MTRQDIITRKTALEAQRDALLRALTQAQADVQALGGAIQFCDQLLREMPEGTTGGDEPCPCVDKDGTRVSIGA